MPSCSFIGPAIFDGTTLYHGAALNITAGRVTSIGPPVTEPVRLPAGILAPGFIDLQVNGAGGLAVDGNATPETLGLICAAQSRLGATGCLPTLITDTAEATAAVIAAGIVAARNNTPGFLGLHLEGPHLDPRRKGAHDPALIRPMTENDLQTLIHAAENLPALMVTVAPESTTADQIAALRAAGAVVSLGHSDCTAQTALAAGADCVTHLFNAMSQLGNREPGLVGAALSSNLYAGLIADGIHVDPVTLRIALAAKPDRVFLVSDCMALAGTDLAEMTLGGRRILRQNGKLTLADGTLAGADLTIPRALQVLTQIGIPPERALAMATTIPATLIGRADLGQLCPGARADMVHLSPDYTLTQVWRAGLPVTSLQGTARDDGGTGGKGNEPRL